MFYPQSSSEAPNLSVRPIRRIFEAVMLHQQANVFNDFSRELETVEHGLRGWRSQYFLLGEVEAAVRSRLRGARFAHIVEQRRQPQNDRRRRSLCGSKRVAVDVVAVSRVLRLAESLQNLGRDRSEQSGLAEHFD